MLLLTKIIHQNLILVDNYRLSMIKHQIISFYLVIYSEIMLTSQHKKLIKDGYRQLKSQNPRFISRVEQKQLIAAISRNIAGDIDRQQRILLAESGTGTGKSLAYLLAAIPLARLFHKKLIVSTATVALQQQLIQHELPLVHQAYQGNFQFTLAKGRRRYCCWHKLKRLSLSTLNTKQSLIIGQLWHAHQNNQWQGDRDSWPTPIPNDIWQRIQSDSSSCQAQLPRHRHCPFTKARQQIQKSQVIVTNHSLLITDLEHGGGIALPEPDDCILIIDEAHLLADITREMSLYQLPLHRTKTQFAELILLIKTVNQKLTSGGFINTRLQCLDAIAELTKLIGKFKDYTMLHSSQFNENILRFSPGKLPKTLSDLAHNYLPTSQRLCRALDQLAGQLQEATGDGQIREAQAENWLSHVGQFQLLAENLQNTLYHCQRENDQTPYAYWFEKSEKSTYLCTSPLDVGAKLQAILWERFFSVAALSATLSALGRFDYFLWQTGLKNRLNQEQQLLIPSPFNYKNVTLNIPHKFPEPDSDQFIIQTSLYIQRYYHKTSAMLVLCTSYVFVEQLRSLLAKTHCANIFCQGEVSNQRLLERYRTTIDQKQPALLIATTGFGEGIDLPGDYLNHLVIPRLPFSVPSDPVTQSYVELIESRGQNPFLQLTLPQTSRKLIQCCGRLMRKESDSGVISILDPRIITRRYGKQLLNALPNYQINYFHCE
ncbi:MAG: ATP-dependent DNA helicase DinG [Candidatus Celerinatantimonas neptuna]|nr:MAG: ATP-dependent DNA helicase DinG [Candidatus Celerinatantimonas neptuna]